ncbi:MAG TPA: hypothetical protein VH143_06555, partial [Kofleriaceae bacterium]|nr:hypothetical protein [Kofleriaceae bacterium]
PRPAVNAMRSIAKGFDELNADRRAMKEQAQASALHWIQYVAQASIGSVSADAVRADHGRTAGQETLTNVARANAAPTTHGDPAKLAGLVDLEFVASSARPQEPAMLRRVFVQGVSNAIAQRLANGPSLLATGLAVRAHGVSREGDAVLPVTVVRDEGGNLRYTDDSGAAGMPGPRWLARKAGATRDSIDDEMRGARILMEDELMANRVPVTAIATDSNDNASK